MQELFSLSKSCRVVESDWRMSSACGKGWNGSGHNKPDSWNSDQKKCQVSIQSRPAYFVCWGAEICSTFHHSVEIDVAQDQFSGWNRPYGYEDQNQVSHSVEFQYFLLSFDKLFIICTFFLHILDFRDMQGRAATFKKQVEILQKEILGLVLEQNVLLPKINSETLLRPKKDKSRDLCAFWRIFWHK